MVIASIVQQDCLFRVSGKGILNEEDMEIQPNSLKVQILRW